MLQEFSCDLRDSKGSYQALEIDGTQQRKSFR